MFICLDFGYMRSGPIAANNMTPEFRIPIATRIRPFDFNENDPPIPSIRRRCLRFVPSGERRTFGDGTVAEVYEFFGIDE